MGRTLLVLTLLLFVTQMAYASENEAPYWYQVFQKRAFDLDKYLESGPMKLQAQTCHYKSFVTGKEVDYAGVGACLYESLTEGFSSNGIPGVITAHFLIMSTNEHAILAVAWRPPKGGFLHVAAKAYRDWKRKPDKGASDTLLGTLVIDFSATNPQAVEDLFGPVEGVLPLLFPRTEDTLSQVRLTAHPRLGHETITDTLVEFYSRTQKPIRKTYLDWNFFIIPDCNIITRECTPQNITFSAGTIK